MCGRPKIHCLTTEIVFCIYLHKCLMGPSFTTKNPLHDYNKVRLKGAKISLFVDHIYCIVSRLKRNGG